MSTRLPRLTSGDLLRVARRLGFVVDRQSGSHAVLFHNTTHQRVVIPVHQKRILKPKTLLGIVEDLGITVEQLRKLL